MGAQTGKFHTDDDYSEDIDMNRITELEAQVHRLTVERDVLRGQLPLVERVPRISWEAAITRAEKAEAAGAEMRKALKDGAVPLEKLRLWILKNFPSGSDPTQEEPRYLYSALDRWLYGSIDDAKESTCGQPLLDELARLRKENEGLKRARQGLGD